MSFQTLLRSLVRGWYLPLICALLGMAAAFALTRNATPSYTAESVVLVTPVSDAAAPTLINTVPTYAQLATMSTILDPVAAELGFSGGAKALEKKVEASVPTATTLIVVSGQDESPTTAAKMSASAAQRLATYLTTSTSTKGQIRAELVQPAPEPTAPSSIARSKVLASGLVFGLGLGAVLAILWGSLRRKSDDASAPGRPLDDSL